jgi:hypothetical protein
MNWKTIRHLINVERKSGRLLRGRNTIKYNVRKSSFYGYLWYGLAIIAGLTVGFSAGYLYNLFSTDPTVPEMVSVYYAGFLVGLPTVVLIFSLVFTMLQQIQRSGVRFARQVPYWLPVTWEEHTLASVFAELLGFPLISVAIISSAVLVFSFYAGQILLAVGSIFSMLAAAFMASATTEILRIVQVRFVGSVYKSSGKAAIWIRFVGVMLFFFLFYLVFFGFTTGTNSLIFLQSIASAQTSLWFVPFVWLGLTLSSFSLSLWLEGSIFLIGSLLFIAILFLLATNLNKRYGLYEPPAIKISREAYAPKTGFLWRLGFSTIQAALIRKDLKAFTRRRELMFTFILPIIFLIVPIMTAVSPSPSQSPAEFWLVYTIIAPASITAISLGSFLTGEEGQAIWTLFASPISAKDFVRSKFTLVLLFSLLVLPVTATIVFFVFKPSAALVSVLVSETVFLSCALGSVSLSNGIKGADFNEIPRPRMMRPEWGLVNILICAGVGLAMMLPFIPYAISILGGASAGILTSPFLATILSGVMSLVFTFVFYRISIGNARELLSKAEI